MTRLRPPSLQEHPSYTACDSEGVVSIEQTGDFEPCTVVDDS